MRSIVARPVSGFSPSASTMSGQRSRRVWLFATISTTRRCGRLARNASVRSSVAALSASSSMRSAWSRQACASQPSTAGCASPASTAVAIGVGQPLEALPRARLHLVVGIVQRARTARSRARSAERQRARARRGGAPRRGASRRTYCSAWGESVEPDRLRARSQCRALLRGSREWRRRVLDGRRRPHPSRPAAALRLRDDLVPRRAGTSS